MSSPTEKAAANRTTMEGMIYNANDVLDSALDPNSKGIPRKLFEMCCGVVLISVVEAGFIFSGNVGTGVVLAKREDGTWSPPSALGLTGIGFGFMVGAEVKDIVVLVMDKHTMAAFSGEGQIKFGGQMSLTLGPVGREADVSLNLSNRGAGGSFSYTFSRGIFGGISLEGAVIGVRAGENSLFYGKEASPQSILFGDDAVSIPEGSGIPDLHRKLDMLTRGETTTLSEKELEKKESMREEADKVAESVKESQTDIVEVNAEEEAKKEEENSKTE